MDIYYHRKQRKITDRTGKEYSYANAMRGIESGRFTSWNREFIVLSQHQGDMDAVDSYYEETA